MSPPLHPVVKRILEVVRKDGSGAMSKFLNMLNPDVRTVEAKPAEPKKGWQCPKCNNVYGPHVDTCENCNTAPKS